MHFTNPPINTAIASTFGHQSLLITKLVCSSCGFCFSPSKLNDGEFSYQDLQENCFSFSDREKNRTTCPHCLSELAINFKYLTITDYHLSINDNSSSIIFDSFETLLLIPDKNGSVFFNNTSYRELNTDEIKSNTFLPEGYIILQQHSAENEFCLEAFSASKDVHYNDIPVSLTINNLNVSGSSIFSHMAHLNAIVSSMNLGDVKRFEQFVLNADVPKLMNRSCLKNKQPFSKTSSSHDISSFLRDFFNLFKHKHIYLLNKTFDSNLIDQAVSNSFDKTNTPLNFLTQFVPNINDKLVSRIIHDNLDSSILPTVRFSLFSLSLFKESKSLEILFDAFSNKKIELDFTHACRVYTVDGDYSVHPETINATKVCDELLPYFTFDSFDDYVLLDDFGNKQENTSKIADAFLSINNDIEKLYNHVNLARFYISRKEKIVRSSDPKSFVFFYATQEMNKWGQIIDKKGTYTTFDELKKDCLSITDNRVSDFFPFVPSSNLVRKAAEGIFNNFTFSFVQNTEELIDITKILLIPHFSKEQQNLAYRHQDGYTPIVVRDCGKPVCFIEYDDLNDVVTSINKSDYEEVTDTDTDLLEAIKQWLHHCSVALDDFSIDSTLYL